MFTTGAVNFYSILCYRICYFDDHFLQREMQKTINHIIKILQKKVALYGTIAIIIFIGLRFLTAYLF